MRVASRPFDALARLDARVARASLLVSWIATGALLLVCFAVLGDVLLRWLLGRPIHGLEDATGLVVTIAIAACLPAGFALRSNITVTTLGTLAGPRARRVLDAFGHLLAFTFVALVAWQLGVHAGDVGPRRTMIAALPEAPAWRIVLVLAVVAAAVQAVVLAAHLAAVLAGPSPPGGGGSDTSGTTVRP